LKGNGNFTGLTKDTMKHYPARLLLLAIGAQRHPATIKEIARKIITAFCSKADLDKEIKRIERDMNTLAELRIVLLYARKKMK